MKVESKSRLAVPLAVSLVVHGAVVGLFGVSLRFSWPAPPIPIELQPRSRPVENVGPEERRGTPAPPHRAPRPPAPRVTASADARAMAKPALPTTRDLRPFAPTSARLVVLLRSDKLRSSPHRTDVEALLSALPDYDTLLGGTNLSLVDDFQALLIATANPYDVTATFLAARARDEGRLRAALAKKTLGPGDPRVFRFLGAGLAVLTRPDGAERLDQAKQGEASDPRREWLTQLERFDQVARAPAGPVVLVTCSEVPALLRFAQNLPTPQTIALAASADAAPAIRLQASFADAAEAERFAAAWPDVLRRWRSLTALLGLSSALDGLTLTRREREIELEGRLSEAHTRLMLSWARAFLPGADEALRPADGGVR